METHAQPEAPADAVGDPQVYDYDDFVIWQWHCGLCDKGLLWAPARFCGRCGGDGYITKTI